MHEFAYIFLLQFSFCIKIASMYTRNQDIRSEDETLKEKTAYKLRQEKNTEEHPFWELLRFAVLAFLIILPIRAFIAQPFIVSGSSMYPTFQDGNYLIVDQISYRFEEPNRGDVIVFRFPKDKKKFFIKRIIGLPNESIKIDGSKVTIMNDNFPDGFDLNEPYVKNLAFNNITVVLGSNEFFVMGDNRSASSDSRSWGNVKDNLIMGRALLRLLPVKNIGIFPGENKFPN